jgi:hypothetical protein
MIFGFYSPVVGASLRSDVTAARLALDLDCDGDIRANSHNCFFAWHDLLSAPPATSP